MLRQHRLNRAKTNAREGVENANQLVRVRGRNVKILAISVSCAIVPCRHRLRLRFEWLRTMSNSTRGSGLINALKSQ